MAQEKDRAAAAQHELIGAANGARHAHNMHPDAQWFETAGLGLFLHWGLSSVEGAVDLSWGMMRNTPWTLKYYRNIDKMRPAEYFAQAGRFDPESYDPDLWLAAAAQAGMKYAVLTTRHHEGYALWPSKYGNFSTRTHMHGRDLVREYVDACRRHGLKVGLYYSPPDWNYCRDYMSFGYFNWKNVETMAAELGMAQEDFSELDVNWQKCAVKQPDDAFRREFRDYLRGQITELLTNYGQIDVIWFDGRPGYGIGEEGSGISMPLTIEGIRALQPGIVINPRMHGMGDFKTPECALPSEQPEGWWEGCFIWCNNWGYTRDEVYKPLSWMLNLLARHRAWEGNFLISCAPRGDGRMPENYYRRMEALGRWMQKNGEAVFGVRGGLWPEKSTVPATQKEGSWYLFMEEGKMSARLHDVPGRPEATLLRTGEKVHCAMEKNGEVLVILKPAQAEDEMPVVRIDWK